MMITMIIMILVIVTHLNESSRAEALVSRRSNNDKHANTTTNTNNNNNSNSNSNSNNNSRPQGHAKRTATMQQTKLNRNCTN